MALQLEKNKFYRRPRIPFDGNSYADMRDFVLNDLKFLSKNWAGTESAVIPQSSHKITSNNTELAAICGLSEDLFGLNTGLSGEQPFNYCQKAGAVQVLANTDNLNKFYGFGFKFHINGCDASVYKDWVAHVPGTAANTKPAVIFTFSPEEGDISNISYISSGLSDWNTVTSIWYGLIIVDGGGFWSGVDTKDSGQYPSSKGQLGLWFCTMKWDADNKEYPAIVYRTEDSIKVVIFNPNDPALNNSILNLSSADTPGGTTQNIVAPMGVLCPFQIPTFGYVSTNLFVKETVSENTFGIFSLDGKKFFGSDYFCLFCKEGS